MYAVIACLPLEYLMWLQYVSTSRSPKEARCKDVKNTNDPKIGNAEPIHTVSAILKHETDNKSPMELRMNVKCPKAVQQVAPLRRWFLCAWAIEKLNRQSP